jgi:hypothetical protein
MLFVKYNNTNFLGFEFEKHLHGDWKYQLDFPGKVSNCFECVLFARAFSYGVSENRMECWCRITSSTAMTYELLCAREKTLVLFLTCSTVQVDGNLL